ncbi:PucR family transcriptional regulator [Actinomadura macrotermitis]|uniref:PucR family transcriptional regulator n=1 Tax=Actinomadura macrotermitis TaxID=2585200 RepID=A0A7K0BT53_9ACTN|nr:helix-turn-helix domain-containing protein [Actinomadura macrotermitis]MQY04360.1 hypothetical protein [Actinomadura macrotermitis]
MPAAWTIHIDLPPAEIAARTPALRRHLPGVAAEAVAEIRRSVPAYLDDAAPLTHIVESTLGHFVDMLERPETGSQEILDRFWRIGAEEARAGRGPEQLQTAVRLGAGVAVRRLTERLENDGLHTPAHVIAQVAQAVFGYLDRIAAAVTAGHAEASEGAGGGRPARRRRLVDLIIGGGAAEGELEETARRADWPLPAEVSVVALRPRTGDAAHRPALPPEVLTGLHLDEPVLIVPDPGGPGRRAMLEHGLHGWAAAIGPPVPVAEAARSLPWARGALALAGQGVLDDRRPIDVSAHLPTLIIMNDRGLVDCVAARLLAPLLELRPSQRRRMAETLLALIECSFNATEVARRLHLHAQTVRYRLRHLESLFGDDLYDPAQRLALHMSLHARLARPGE